MLIACARQINDSYVLGINFSQDFRAIMVIIVIIIIIMLMFFEILSFS